MNIQPGTKMQELTDTWIVRNRGGRELARVNAPTFKEARETALKFPAVTESSEREGGFFLRRLAANEI
jgi:hypothetical protein